MLKSQVYCGRSTSFENFTKYKLMLRYKLSNLSVVIGNLTVAAKLFIKQEEVTEILELVTLHLLIISKVFTSVSHLPASIQPRTMMYCVHLVSLSL